MAAVCSEGGRIVHKESGGRTDLRPDAGRLAESVGLYLDPDREVWRVVGPGAVPALHGLLTNDIAGPPSGSRIPALALTPKGRPLADLGVWKRADDILLDLPRVSAASLRGHFARYLPPRLARVEADPDAVVTRLLGPASGGALREAGAGAEVGVAGRFGAFPGETGRLLAAPRTPEEGAGHDLLRLGPPSTPGWAALLAAIEAAGGGPIPEAGYETWRVEHGIPLYGRDFDEENLPQETGLTERTVSFEKGCYTGQEVVARIHYRGHVNRLLRGLRLRPGAAVRTGDPLFGAGRELGRVGSTALSPRLGPIALAMVRREVDPGAELSLSADGSPEATVVALPFTIE